MSLANTTWDIMVKTWDLHGISFIENSYNHSHLVNAPKQNTRSEHAWTSEEFLSESILHIQELLQFVTAHMTFPPCANQDKENLKGQ